MRIAASPLRTLPLNEPDCRRYRRRFLYFQLALFGRVLRERLERVRVDSVLHLMAELRMGAISAGWGNRRRLLLEQFMQGFELFYADNDLCTESTRTRS